MVVSGAACVALAAVFAVAVVLADMLGFLGLFLIGGMTWLICVRATLASEAPTWSTQSLAARLVDERAPEQRAARDAERQATLVPLRFFGRCGMALAAIGAAGFAWQYWLAANAH